jgi:hypothetical protein
MARRQERDAGGDQQGAVGAFKHGAEGLDGAPVRGTVFREFREVVIEGCVDYAVRCGRPGPEGVQLLERTAIDLGAGRSEGRRARIGAGETDQLMAGAISSWTMAEPTNPVAPVTKTRITIFPCFTPRP